MIDLHALVHLSKSFLGLVEEVIDDTLAKLALIRILIHL